MELNIRTGYIYILSNPAMPGLLKIGFTEISVRDRMIQLNTTGVPIPFELVHSVEVDHPQKVEAIIHKSLQEFRLGKNREFFRVSHEKAIAITEKKAEPYATRLRAERARKKAEFDRLQAERKRQAEEEYKRLEPQRIAAQKEVERKEAERSEQFWRDSAKRDSDVKIATWVVWACAIGITVWLDGDIPANISGLFYMAIVWFFSWMACSAVIYGRR